jgi:hypothetical protein
MGTGKGIHIMYILQKKEQQVAFTLDVDHEENYDKKEHSPKIKRPHTYI